MRPHFNAPGARERQASSERLPLGSVANVPPALCLWGIALVLQRGVAFAQAFPEPGRYIAARASPRPHHRR